MAEFLHLTGLCVRGIECAILAIAPGMLFWLLIIGIYTIVQRVKHRSPQQH